MDRFLKMVGDSYQLPLRPLPAQGRNNTNPHKILYVIQTCVTFQVHSKRSAVIESDSRHGYPRLLALHAIRDSSDDSYLSTNLYVKSWNWQYIAAESLPEGAAGTGSPSKLPSQYSANHGFPPPVPPAQLGRASIRADNLAFCASVSRKMRSLSDLQQTFAL